MGQLTGRRGGARERVLAAAVFLWSRHGVNGTSLQMIADALGVTKAAVYHQFKSKDDIILAVLRPVFAELNAVADTAGLQPTPAGRRDAALTGLVELVVRHRTMAAVFRGDPGMTHLIPQHEELRGVAERVALLLTGPRPTTAGRIAVSMVAGGMMLSGADLALADLDDAALREGLLASARRVLVGLDEQV